MRFVLYAVALLMMAGIVIAAMQLFPVPPPLSSAPTFEPNVVAIPTSTSTFSVATSTIMELKSGIFREGSAIPEQYTCDGEDINPLLELKGVPETAKSLALTLLDPDATGGRTFTHWLIWNLPTDAAYIPDDGIPAGAVEGTNDFGRVGYGGPCPPKGAKAHRYVFTLYALDTTLSLPEGASRSDLEAALQGHVIEEATLTGTYGR